MDIDGLTIYHVKSHLQKYRMNHVLEKSKKEPKEKYPSSDLLEGENEAKKEQKEKDKADTSSEVEKKVDTDRNSGDDLQDMSLDNSNRIIEEMRKHTEMQRKLEMQLQVQIISRI